MWILFRAPCPTPDGQTAQDLYERRIPWITPEMQASAREHGCKFHRAWYAEDNSEFIALANWETEDGARAFFRQWNIESEPGETGTILLGDVGLVTEP